MIRHVVVPIGEGTLSGGLAAAVTMAGFVYALDPLMLSREGVSPLDFVVLFGGPFAGAAMARAILPISGGVSIVWLGSLCLAGLLVGLRTCPWPGYWGTEQAVLRNTIWVLSSMVGFSVTGASWSRWRARRASA